MDFGFSVPRVYLCMVSRKKHPFVSSASVLLLMVLVDVLDHLSLLLPPLSVVLSPVVNIVVSFVSRFVVPFDDE
jgi:putative flippase GtrA